MATNAIPGIGAKFNRWDTSGTSGVWVALAEVTNIGLDGPSRESIDVFVLDNPDEYMDKVQGVLNSNAVSITINYTKAQFALLKAEMETRGLKQYQVVLPDGAGITFSGFITELPLENGSDDVIQGDMSIEISGKAEFQSTAT